MSMNNNCTPGSKNQNEAEMPVQVAALPWRRRTGRLEICMVTSRRTGRWILPKGWPEPGLNHAETAALEAWEEAGLRGDISRQCYASYETRKFVPPDETIPVTMEIYLLKDPKQYSDWPEKGQREVKWFAVDEAIENARDIGLATLLKSFEPAE
jgi:8-oxo-dGTP pyrophosphatase MutT (NUDIX family)